jgi:UDP-glucose 4-epimerase
MFVTGAGGFIGAHVVEALRGAGARVLAHLGPPGTDARSLVAEQCSTAEIDDLEAFAGQMRGADAVVHLAGPPSVAASFRQPDLYARAHAQGTATVLAAMRRNGVKRIVYLSSAEIYGRPETNPVAETAAPRPLSPYATAKVAAEGFIRAAAAAGDAGALILRPFSVYGPGLPDHSLLGAILAQGDAAGQVRLANPDVVRDYVFVADVARAVAMACGVVGAAGTVTCNLGSGVGVSARDLATRALAAMGRPGRVLGAAPLDRPAGVDIPILIADPCGAEQRLGWRCRSSLEDGLALTLAWRRRQAASS